MPTDEGRCVVAQYRSSAGHVESAEIEFQYVLLPRNSSLPNGYDE